MTQRANAGLGSPIKSSFFSFEILNFAKRIAAFIGMTPSNIKR